MNTFIYARVCGEGSMCIYADMQERMYVCLCIFERVASTLAFPNKFPRRASQPYMQIREIIYVTLGRHVNKPLAAAHTLTC